MEGFPSFSTGTDALKQVAATLKQIAGDDGLVARLGGGSFAICLENSVDNASKTYGKVKTKVEVARNPENETNIKEQNLYKYDKSYREASDRASYLGSYLDNWDKNGGPKTAEGRANYQRMLRELNALEAQLNAKRK